MSEQHFTALASLEVPTMISSAGAPAVMAIIEHLNSSECRMRSVNAFEFGAKVEFSAALYGSQPLHLAGVIASRKQNGPRYAYGVALDATSEQAAAISAAVQAARSRPPSAPHVPDVPAEHGLTRASVRIAVDFEVRCTYEGAPHRVVATNISNGGLLMNSSETFPVGASLELQLPLGETPVRVHGRVVAHQAASPNYNIAFYDVHDAARDEIARYIDLHLTA